ncbi:MAG: UbiA family prenyltransferase [Euryarchaeota archaeon]|nr:UbiA family prenyltransferase [Euryarchaeota archaeon]
MSSIAQWWTLVRGPNLVLAFAGVLAGALAGAGPSGLQRWEVPVAALGAVLITAGGNVLNDLGDLEVDRVNRPARPLPSGTIPIERIRGVPRAGFSLGLLCAMAAGPLPLLVAAAAIATLSLYENRLKLGPAKNLPVSIAVGLLFPYGGLVVGNPLPGALLGLLAFLATLGREVAKDLEDLSGDRRERTTLASVLGPRRAGLFASGALAGAILVSPLPSLLGLLPPAYLTAALGADLLFLLSAATVRAAPSSARRFAKGGMALAVAGLLLGVAI